MALDSLAWPRVLHFRLALCYLRGKPHHLGVTLLSALLLSSWAMAANPCKALKTIEDPLGEERRVTLSEGGAGLIILRERQGVITLILGFGLNRGPAVVSAGTDITLPAGTKVDVALADGSSVELLTRADAPPQFRVIGSDKYSLWALEFAPTKEQLLALAGTPVSYRADIDGNRLSISLGKENQRALAAASTCLSSQ